jgi:hypothetical protein
MQDREVLKAQLSDALEESRVVTANLAYINTVQPEDTKARIEDAQTRIRGVLALLAAALDGVAKRGDVE